MGDVFVFVFVCVCVRLEFHNGKDVLYWIAWHSIGGRTARRRRRLHDGAETARGSWGCDGR